MAQDFLGTYVTNIVQQEVQKQLAAYMPELYSTAKASKDILVAIGDALPERLAIKLKENFPLLLDYMKTEEAKECLEMFVSGLIDYSATKE